MIVRKLIITKSGSFYINIPSQIIKKLGWQKDDSIAIKIQKDTIVLKKVEEVF